MSWFFLAEYMCIYFKTRSLKDLQVQKRRPEVIFFILLNILHNFSSLYFRKTLIKSPNKKLKIHQKGDIFRVLRQTSKHEGCLMTIYKQYFLCMNHLSFRQSLTFHSQRILLNSKQALLSLRINSAKMFFKTFKLQTTKTILLIGDITTSVFPSFFFVHLLMQKKKKKRYMALFNWLEILLLTPKIKCQNICGNYWEQGMNQQKLLGICQTLREKKTSCMQLSTTTFPVGRAKRLHEDTPCTQFLV